MRLRLQYGTSLWEFTALSQVPGEGLERDGIERAREGNDTEWGNGEEKRRESGEERRVREGKGRLWKSPQIFHWYDAPAQNTAILLFLWESHSLNKKL